MAAPNFRWRVPAEGIHRDVIQEGITRYLGPDAIVRPGRNHQGSPGYDISAYRTLTPSMIADLRADSQTFEKLKATYPEFSYSVGLPKVSYQLGTAASTPSSSRAIADAAPSDNDISLDAMKPAMMPGTRIDPSTANRVEPINRIIWHNPQHHHVFAINQAPVDLVRSIGSGSVGFVDEVRTHPNASTVVRKRVTISQQQKKYELVQAEVSHLKALKNPHIVSLVGTYEERDPRSQNTLPRFYSILMAPVGSGNLKELLHSSEIRAQCGLDAQDFSRWFQCLAKGLEYLHSQNIRHQDIKPENIVFRGKNILFTDFSSARRFKTGETSTEQTCQASKIYAAPELLDTNGNWSYSRHGLGTDIYSLGLVFLEMRCILTGSTVASYQDRCFRELRFLGASLEDFDIQPYSILTSHGLSLLVLSFPTIPDHPPPPWNDIIFHKMLAYERKERLSAHELVEQLSIHPHYGCVC